MFNLSKNSALAQFRSSLRRGSSVPASHFSVISRETLQSTNDPEFLERPRGRGKAGTTVHLPKTKYWPVCIPGPLPGQDKGAHGNPPVQPRQQGLGGAYELHHGSQELVGRLAGRVPVVRRAFPPAADVILQVVGRCPQLQNQVLHVIGFKAVILWETQPKGKIQNNQRCPNSHNDFKAHGVTGITPTMATKPFVIYPQCSPHLRDFVPACASSPKAPPTNIGVESSFLPLTT